MRERDKGERRDRPGSVGEISRKEKQRKMRAKIYVTLKNGILDPQGKAIEHALSALGFKEVKEARVGKYLEVALEPAPLDQIEKRVKEMCEKLLANTVIETYRYELEPAE